MKIGKQGGSPVKLKRTMTTNQKLWSIIRIILLIGLIIGLVWSQNNMVFTSDYIYTSERVPKTFVGYTIVNVSDLHNSNIGVVRAVKGCKPDIILVSGGLTDDNGKYNNSIKTIEKLSNIAPTYYVLGDNDTEQKDTIINSMGNGPILIEDVALDISAPEIDTQAFIEKYIGNRLVGESNKGNEDAKEYIEYTKEKLEEDANKTIRISGLSYKENTTGLVDKIYDIIGTDKSVFQVNIVNQASLFDTISIADIDIVFSGETHGNKDIVPGYSKGVYAKSGTTLFLSSGIGNTKNHPGRIFNYPSIISVKLSDGTIKNENPLEQLLSYFISDVKTKFDNDEGFKTYKYEYYNGYDEN